MCSWGFAFFCSISYSLNTLWSGISETFLLQLLFRKLEPVLWLFHGGVGSSKAFDSSACRAPTASLEKEGGRKLETSTNLLFQKSPVMAQTTSIPNTKSHSNSSRNYFREVFWSSRDRRLWDSIEGWRNKGFGFEKWRGISARWSGGRGGDRGRHRRSLLCCVACKIWLQSGGVWEPWYRWWCGSCVCAARLPFRFRSQFSRRSLHQALYKPTETSQYCLSMSLPFFLSFFLCAVNGLLGLGSKR